MFPASTNDYRIRQPKCEYRKAMKEKRRTLFLTDQPRKISINGITYTCTLRFASAKNGQDQLCRRAKSAEENKQPPSRHNYWVPF